MATRISISSRLKKEKPVIEIDGVDYEVSDTMTTVLEFEDLIENMSTENAVKAIEIALGKQAAKEIGIKEMRLENFKILVTAILACMQGIEYEEAERRFRGTGEQV